MNVDTLVSIIIISGIIFLSISLSIVILGKKVGTGGTQTIKIGEYFKAQTNSILMLIVIMSLFTLTPVVLIFYNPEAMRYIGESKLEQQYLRKSDLNFEITGIISLDDTEPAGDYDVTVNAGSEPVNFDKITDIGYYEIQINPIKVDKNYDIVWSKNDYSDHHFRFRYNSIKSGINLKKVSSE